MKHILESNKHSDLMDIKNVLNEVHDSGICNISFAMIDINDIMYSEGNLTIFNKGANQTARISPEFAGLMRETLQRMMMVTDVDHITLCNIGRANQFIQEGDPRFLRSDLLTDFDESLDTDGFYGLRMCIPSIRGIRVDFFDDVK